jgi:hypothetical protein
VGGVHVGTPPEEHREADVAVVLRRYVQGPEVVDTRRLSVRLALKQQTQALLLVRLS